MFRRRRAPRPTEPRHGDPAPEMRVESYSHEVFVYDMDDFRARLGLSGNPHDILTVHITWDRQVEVQMSSRLPAMGHTRGVCPLVRKKG